jgi:hypothetical protein
MLVPLLKGFMVPMDIVILLMSLVASVPLLMSLMASILCLSLMDSVPLLSLMADIPLVTSLVAIVPLWMSLASTVILMRLLKGLMVLMNVIILLIFITMVPLLASLVPVVNLRPLIESHGCSVSDPPAEQSHFHTHDHSHLPTAESHICGSPQAPAASHGVLDDDGGGGSDGSEKIMPCTACNLKPCGEAKPSQLGFYASPWVDILIMARNNYRKLIHTVDPFPEQNADSLKDVHDILLEAIAEYMDGGGEIEEGLLILFTFEAC